MSTKIDAPHTVAGTLIVACTVVIIIMMIVRIAAYPHHEVTAILLVTLTFCPALCACIMNLSLAAKCCLLLHATNVKS